MSTVTTLPQSRPLVRADLETMPDDGHRYELLDGVLLVSPAPRRSHQRAVRGLFRVLDQACPEELELLFAPFDVVLADDTVLEPDLLVAPRSQFTERDLPGPPLLAVEVLSASTRRIDLLLKRDRLQSAGVPSSRRTGSSIRTCRRSPRSSCATASTSRPRTSSATRRGRRSGRTASPSCQPSCCAS